jgi:hypothetical protein
MPKFKAIVRVVKSIGAESGSYFGADNDVLRVPIIEAEDKAAVKEYMKKEFPQFFQNGKVYERETKDTTQFFYVVIYPLYNWEEEMIQAGEWVCDQCGHVHENEYLERPVKPRKPPFNGKKFCNMDTCYENYKTEYYKGIEMPDDMVYVKEDSPSYIYRICEKSSNKSYVGKTRNAPFFRWWNHLKHSSSPFGLYLQATQLTDWTFEVLEILPSEVPDSEVFMRESHYMNVYDSVNNGFNVMLSNSEARVEIENQMKLFEEDI